MKTEARYQSFAEFYPFYLGEHQNSICRRLHVIGTTIVIAVFIYAIVSCHFWLLLLQPLIGYGFAWVGHYFFENNRPATFTDPWFSLLGDYKMWWDVVTLKLRW